MGTTTALPPPSHFWAIHSSPGQQDLIWPLPCAEPWTRTDELEDETQGSPRASGPLTVKLINTPAGVQEEQQGELLTVAAPLLVVLLSSLYWSYCNVERLNWPGGRFIFEFCCSLWNSSSFVVFFLLSAAPRQISPKGDNKKENLKLWHRFFWRNE